jgi:hypothetical protein
MSVRKNKKRVAAKFSKFIRADTFPLLSAEVKKICPLEQIQQPVNRLADLKGLTLRLGGSPQGRTCLAAFTTGEDTPAPVKTGFFLSQIRPVSVIMATLSFPSTTDLRPRP